MSNTITALLPKLFPVLFCMVGLVAALVVQVGVGVEAFMQSAERRTRTMIFLRIVNGGLTLGALVILLGAMAGAAYGARKVLVKPANMSVPAGYDSAHAP